MRDVAGRDGIYSSNKTMINRKGCYILFSFCTLIITFFITNLIILNMGEITFLVHETKEGGYYAEAAGVGIFAEGDSVEVLKENIKGGIKCFYRNREDAPAFAHLHFVKDEILAL